MTSGVLHAGFLGLRSLHMSSGGLEHTFMHAHTLGIVLHNYDVTNYLTTQPNSTTDSHGDMAFHSWHGD